MATWGNVQSGKRRSLVLSGKVKRRDAMAEQGSVRYWQGTVPFSTVLALLRIVRHGSVTAAFRKVEQRNGKVRYSSVRAM